MRLLFVKHSLAWPRSSGHDVHTFHMMKACAALGHEISLATVREPSGEAVAGIPLRALVKLDPAGPTNGIAGKATWLQNKFRSYWGVSDAQVTSLVQAVDALSPDAVIVGGLDALPYFPPLSGVVRVWYAADEWVLHHLSQAAAGDGHMRENVRDAAVKGIYERAHRHAVDRVWVVSDGDRRAMRWLAGMDHVDVLPNGVDAEFFCPGDEPVENRTAVFWGRLDFGPNIQGLEWFCRRVWPLVRRRAPDARFTIIGFQPTERVRALAAREGIDLKPDVPDLRHLARRNAVVVLPFVSGAGIKNKLLEAAAMGLPIVCTPAAVRGLRSEPPVVTAATPDAMAAALLELWNTPQRRRKVGVDGRAWVIRYHTWNAAANEAIAGLTASREGVVR